MQTSKRSTLTLLAVLAAMMLVVAGCGSKSSSSNASPNGAATQSNAAPTSTTPQKKTRFAKTKFVLHAALAFGAFHRYIYKPFKAGSFTGGSLGRHKLAVVKAGLAGLFAFHELKLAYTDAKSSPLLSKLLTPITALVAKLQSLGNKLKGGTVDKAAIESVNTGAAGVSGAAQGAGQSITEQIPSAAQLVRGA